PDGRRVGDVLRAGRARRERRRAAPEPVPVPDGAPVPRSRVPRAGRVARGARAVAVTLAIVRDILVQLAQMALVLAAAPFFTGFVRKVRAHLQRKKGPSVFQPYRELYRLMCKEPVAAENASWLFRGAPYVIF